jgi:hypothetical protein
MFWQGDYQAFNASPNAISGSRSLLAAQSHTQSRPNQEVEELGSENLSLKRIFEEVITQR